jgi:Domain of unknown function (DUF222)
VNRIPVARIPAATGRSAGSLLELSRRLARLPQTQALLAAGVIDRARAGVIADQLSLLDDAAAAAVQDRVAPRAAAMTTGQLAAACRRAVLAYDPQAAARRRERAQREARVECWAEPAGTGSIAGRDLNLAGVIAADQHLDAAARWLQHHGAAGTLDQLRAQVFLAGLAGQPLDSLLPASPAPPARPAPAARPAPPAAAGPARTRSAVPPPVAACPAAARLAAAWLAAARTRLRPATLAPGLPGWAGQADSAGP